MEDDKAEVQDPFLDKNLGEGTESQPTFISSLLSEEQQRQLIVLLNELIASLGITTRCLDWIGSESMII